MAGCRMCSRVWVTALALLCMCIVPGYVRAVREHCEPIASVTPHKFNRSVHQHDHRELRLVDSPQVVLTYYNGTLLIGPSIPIYIIWFGRFSPAQKAILLDFLASFAIEENVSGPSVASWWNITSSYKMGDGTPVAPTLSVVGQMTLAPSGYTLTRAALQNLVVRSLKKFPANSNAVYIVFTADDIQVESFCMNTCASHFDSAPEKTNGKSLPYVWVGNPAAQCPGLCAWPYGKPAYGPPNFVPLVSPNGDIGIDGMIINLGSMLAGVATNPFDTGYYQGDASAPLEAATACTGIYGDGAYAGYPGQLLVDSATNASYNVKGANNREFLLSALWDPITSLCTPPR